MGQGFIRAREFSINFHAPQQLTFSGGGHRESVGEYLAGIDRSYAASRGCGCCGGGWFGGGFWGGLLLGGLSSLMGWLGGGMGNWFGGMSNWFGGWGNLNMGYGSGWGVNNIGGNGWFGGGSSTKTDTTAKSSDADLTRTNKSNGSDNNGAGGTGNTGNANGAGNTGNANGSGNANGAGNAGNAGNATTTWAADLSAEDQKKLEDAGIKKDVYEKLKAKGLDVNEIEAYGKAGIIDNPTTIIKLHDAGLTDPTEIAKLKDLGIDLTKTGIDILNGIDENKIGGLNPNTAKVLLDIAGYVNNDGVGKMSGNYKVLLLLEKSGINVNVAHNDKAPDNEGMIRGQISGVTKDGDGNVTYTVNNQTVQDDYGLKYTFKGNNQEGFKLTKIENNTDTERKIRTGWKDRVYNFKGEGNNLEISALPLVSVNGTLKVDKKHPLT